MLLILGVPGIRRFVSMTKLEMSLFWRNNLPSVNGMPFSSVPSAPPVVVFSDASTEGCAAFTQGKDIVFHRN